MCVNDGLNDCIQVFSIVILLLVVANLFCAMMKY